MARIIPAKGKKGLQGADVDFETTWAILENAFREIHTKNASKLSFEELYRSAYKIVLKKRGADLYNNVANFEARWLADNVRTGVTRQLTTPLMLLTEERGAGPLTGSAERRTAGEGFLRQLKQSWEDHQVCMGMLTDVLMYMVSDEKPNNIRYGACELTAARTAYIAQTIANRPSLPKPWASSVTRYCVRLRGRLDRP